MITNIQNMEPLNVNQYFDPDQKVYRAIFGDLWLL
jgi:hypothetical protein